MSDLISRENLKQRMYHEAFETDSDLQKWDSGCWIRYKLFENVIDTIPSVEIVASWMKVQELLWHGYRCTNCFYDVNKKSNYCPNCGAKMKRSE